VDTVVAVAVAADSAAADRVHLVRVVVQLAVAQVAVALAVVAQLAVVLAAAHDLVAVVLAAEAVRVAVDDSACFLALLSCPLQMSRSTAKTDATRSKSFAVDAARLMSELKCSDIVVFDLVGRSQICDYMIIASGTSQRQMKSVGEAIDKMGKTQGSPAWRMSADTGTSWIVVDFVDVVVHLFEPNQRAFYDIEGIWPDASRLTWRASASAR